MKKPFIKLFGPLLVILLFIGSTFAAGATNGGSSWNPYKYGECTWYAWKATKELTGTTLSELGNAEDWYSAAEAAGYSVGTVPKANSVVVFRDIGSATKGLGHVAYVRSVNGNTMNISEGSYKNMLVHEDTIATDTDRWRGSRYQQRIIGYIYVAEKLVTETESEEVYALSLPSSSIKLNLQGVKETKKYEIPLFSEKNVNTTKQEKLSAADVMAYREFSGIQLSSSILPAKEDKALSATPASLKTQDEKLTANKSPFKLISVPVGLLF